MLKRNSVIPFPGGEENTILMSFVVNDKGRLRNVTIVHPGIASRFEAHQKELDALAEEFSQRREAITAKRAEIEAAAFAEREKKIAKEEADRKRRDAEAKAEKENSMSPDQ